MRNVVWILNEKTEKIRSNNQAVVFGIWEFMRTNMILITQSQLHVKRIFDLTFQILNKKKKKKLNKDTCPPCLSSFGSCDNTTGSCTCNSCYGGIICNEVTCTDNSVLYGLIGFAIFLFLLCIAMIIVYCFVHRRHQRQMESRLLRNRSGSERQQGVALEEMKGDKPSDVHNELED